MVWHINPQGWLEAPDTQPVFSPHYNARPEGAEISLIVLHNISLPPNEYGYRYVDALFLGQMPQYQNAHPFFAEIAHLSVSAHFFIGRDGAIRQYVSTLNRAWHAGVSAYEGRENCNDYSIGIEINGSDHAPYALRQYQSCARLIRALEKRHPACKGRITTHQHIAPTRKTDPGPAWNHAYLLKLLSSMQEA